MLLQADCRELRPLLWLGSERWLLELGPLPSVESKFKRERSRGLAVRKQSPSAVAVNRMVAAAASHARRLRSVPSNFLSRNYPRLPSTIAPSIEHVERSTAVCLFTLRSEKVRNRI